VANRISPRERHQRDISLAPHLGGTEEKGKITRTTFNQWTFPQFGGGNELLLCDVQGKGGDGAKCMNALRTALAR
jgi:hypothetical protein